jgi:DMSO/TMAO reductase YedYZ molybdopterin-dependent catalytic subunit
MAGGMAASTAALAVMVLLRHTLQIRTVPERVMEAMLLVIPLDLFGIVLRRYGSDAKWYALALTSIAIVLLLTSVGALVVARHWSLRRIILLGIGLWLFVMGVLMPTTGAGHFAVDLVDGAAVTATAHAAVAFAYTGALAIAVSTVAQSDRRPVARTDRRPGAGARLSRARVVTAASRPPVSRRSALVLSTGVAWAILGTLLVARLRSQTVTRLVVISDDTPPGSDGNSQAVAPAQPTAVATRDAAPTATAISERSEAPAPTATATAQPRASATPGPGLDEQFQPPLLRRPPRDKDGVVLASGRRPGQLADAITASDDFYVVSKNAAQDPVLRLDGWRLRVDGAVQRPIEIDYRSLRNLPSVETVKTLECISNFVTKCELVPFGCDLISTSRWRGARIKDILTLAGGIKPGVTSLSAIAADDFTTTLPIEAVMDPDTILAYEMDGRPLAREHGYPARVLIPGRYGMKNAKWVVALRPLASDRDDWYGLRNWSKHGLVKTMTRIDTPARDEVLPPGTHRMAGIAYAGDRGIQKVEVSSDGGEQWRLADIIDRPAGRDVWVRWESSFTLTAATTLTLMARATDGAGDLQVETFSLPQPDGSTGWHALDVRARDDG